MSNSAPIHLAWLVVTAVAFVVGSQFARFPPVVLGTGNGGNGTPRLHPTQSDASHPVQGETGRSATLNESHPNKRNTPSKVSADSPSIRSLVHQSINGASPLTRRRAFDQILGAVATSTHEQVMELRIAMFESGASGGQWRLLDYAWGASHPDAAVARIDEIPDIFREDYIGNMLPGLASENPKTAIDLFSSFDPKLQTKLRSRLLEGLVDNDVGVATRYIFDENERAESYDWRPIDILAREIAKERGLDSTLEWASELAEGPLRGSAWSAAYADWGSRQPQAAVDSIIAMPSSADRNQAINGFISGHAHRDAEAAVIWAAEISEPHLRQEAQIRAGRQFFKQDQTAAADWFIGSGLPSDAWDRVAQ